MVATTSQNCHGPILTGPPSKRVSARDKSSIGTLTRPWGGPDKSGHDNWGVAIAQAITSASSSLRRPSRPGARLRSAWDANGRCGRCLPMTRRTRSPAPLRRSGCRLPAPMIWHAQHLVGLGVGQDLHKAVGGRDGLGAGIGGEGKFADLVGDAGGLQLFFGLADAGDFRRRCRPPPEWRRNSHAPPCRRCSSAQATASSSALCASIGPSRQSPMA